MLVLFKLVYQLSNMHMVDYFGLLRCLHETPFKTHFSFLWKSLKSFEEIFLYKLKQ